MEQRKGDEDGTQRRKVEWYMRFKWYRRVDVFQVAQKRVTNTKDREEKSSGI